MDTQSDKHVATPAPPKKPKMGSALSVKKENAPEFSDKENEVLIRVSVALAIGHFRIGIGYFRIGIGPCSFQTYGRERRVLESNGISNKTRDAAWQRIADAINAVSDVAQRQVKDVKVRRKNIMKAYVIAKVSQRICALEIHIVLSINSA